jgi:hypothetical protein
MWPFSDSKRCDCASYPHLTLDRKAISTRIKQSKSLKKRLQPAAEDSQLGITLLRCPVCGEMWQSGREWNFANEEYLFRVPSITPDEWQHEHYRQPAAMMIYTAMMTDYYSRPFTASPDKCRADGCEERASVIGVFCRRHQVEELQRLEKLPKPPSGRLFPPYNEEKTG